MTLKDNDKFCVRKYWMILTFDIRKKKTLKIHRNLSLNWRLIPPLTFMVLVYWVSFESLLEPTLKWGTESLSPSLMGLWTKVILKVNKLNFDYFSSIKCFKWSLIFVSVFKNNGKEHLYDKCCLRRAVDKKRELPHHTILIRYKRNLRLLTVAIFNISHA